MVTIDIVTYILLKRKLQKVVSDIKDNVYTKEEVDDLIGNSNGSVKKIVVDSLPESGINENAIYMIPNAHSSDGDLYNEYIYVENKWELLGTNVDPIYNELAILNNRIMNEVRSDTVDGWNSDRTYISEDGVIYVYLDYSTYTDDEGNEVQVPGIKIGDGKSYLIDMPFVQGHNKQFDDHINNMIVHITQEERDFWNNKVRCYLNPINTDTLVFTTN